MDYLIAPLEYDFMVKAIIVSALVGIVCALLSCFLVLRRWSLMGDAVSHSVLPGVVLAYVFALPYSIGAFIFGLGGVLGIGYIKNKVRLHDDAVIGIVYTTLFALGLVLVSKIPSNIDLMHILFGYVLGISDGDAWQVGLIAIGVSVLVLALRRSLLLYVFDPSHARAIRMNVSFYHYLLLVLLALTVVASVQTVGVVLVVAMLITPGAIAHLWTDRFDRMLAIAATVSVFACIVGAYASYYFDVSTGGAMVLVLGIVFACTFLVAPRYGVLSRGRRRIKNA
ncbi:metal ABC transporter permease [Streptomyces caniscabiei]|uniref:metal ABC transporter permease n=1 Tax=Streptomyces caniscabiei TaxID=2746961 RepID=UPI0029BAC54D|nr:metal ABC transporter permease [Streptomyces caniscabiei]MDX2776348.1 metal ABC transporter permease [Streptomyces caniscabiei]